MEFEIPSLSSYQNIVAAVIAAGAAVWYNRKKQDHDDLVFKQKLLIKYNELFRGTFKNQLEKIYLIEVKEEQDAENKGLTLEQSWDEFLSDEPSETPEWIKNIHDYLNVCSEQHYWFKKGYVELHIWEVWLQGMRRAYNYSYFIRKIVESEREEKTKYYTPDFFSLFEVDDFSEQELKKKRITKDGFLKIRGKRRRATRFLMNIFSRDS